MSNFVEFVIRGKIDGVEITPSTINLSLFNEFNTQVEAFIAGSVGGGMGRKLMLDKVFAEVESGSYILRTAMSAAMMLAVEPQLQLLAENKDGISKIDETRAKIVEKWQNKASSYDDLTFEMRATSEDGSVRSLVRIGGDTNFVRVDSEMWRPVETFLIGEIVDIGGENPNVHLRLVESPHTVIVSTDRNTLKGLEKNILYERALLHVIGEQHAVTGRYQKLRLLEFVKYDPDYKEDELRAFMEKGKEAWVDVPDASAWVREMRGET